MAPFISASRWRVSPTGSCGRRTTSARVWRLSRRSALHDSRVDKRAEKRGALARLAELAVEPDDEEDDVRSSIPDERLALIFACGHPAQALAAQLALTLRLLGGLATPEIARAFLTS